MWAIALRRSGSDALDGEDIVKRRMRVRLDMPALMANRSREEGHAVPEEQVVEWLKDAGFTREDETHWTVLEADLGQLEPSEVLEVEPLDE
jgi:hypothetical protein